jgi:sugar lactone lactonase YvrE
MRLQLQAALTVLAWGFAGGSMSATLAGCQGDDSSAPPVTSDASTARDSSSTSDAHGDGASSEAGATPTFLAHIPGNPEGLWQVTAGSPIVSIAGGATLLTVSGSSTTTFSSLVAADAAALNTFTLGITSDTAGNVYVGVAATGAGPNPAPGIYKIPSAGGTATLFSAASAVTPAMNFANGLDWMNGNLYVADSNGTIYKVSSTGTATVWATDPLLNPDPAMTACGGFPFAIGANGIAHDTSAFYVANTNFGRLIKIPIQTDGTAGTATALVDNCDLKGADGVAFDTVTNSVIVAVNIQNRIERVSLTGQRTVLFSGAPLDAPASVFIDTSAGGRRLLFTNAAFFDTDPAAAQPGLLALPL